MGQEASRLQPKPGASTPASSASRDAISCIEPYKAGTNAGDGSKPQSRGVAKARLWARSLAQQDPRRKILEFFRPGDERGPLGYLQSQGWKLNPDPHRRSRFFAVWQPMSTVAIRMVMDGTATSKGPNVKGKSATRGKLSGFVPFIQISREADKRKCSLCPPDKRVQVYYQSREAREQVLLILGPVLGEMIRAASSSQQQPKTLHEQENCHMVNARINLLDGFAPTSFGIDVPERLFFEAYIMRQDISPREGWDSGGPSEPAFMDLNFRTTRQDAGAGGLKAVVWQYDAVDSMNPQGLLLAYAENSVKPVASDVDGFLIGSKGLQIEPLPDEQVSLCGWAIDRIQEALEDPGHGGWVRRWHAILKDQSNKGFSPPHAELGYGDPIYVSIMASAVDHLSLTGAPRHGTAFNFYFPREMDSQFMVVWDGFENLSWKYLDEAELRSFLLARVAEGYSFPLNPKWLLCDHRGWWEIFQAMQASSDAKKSLEKWFAPSSGIIKRMADLHDKYPKGFVQQAPPEGQDLDVLDADVADDLLRRHTLWRRARARVRAIFRLQRVAKPTRLDDAGSAVAQTTAERAEAPALPANGGTPSGLMASVQSLPPSELAVAVPLPPSELAAAVQPLPPTPDEHAPSAAQMGAATKDDLARTSSPPKRAAPRCRHCLFPISEDPFAHRRRMLWLSEPLS